MLQNADHGEAFVNIVRSKHATTIKPTKSDKPPSHALGNKKVGAGRANLDAYDKVINNC